MLVEDKGVTGSIHFRQLDSALVEPLRMIVAEEVGQKKGTFRIAEGKKVFEILPEIDWNKGAGIRKLINWLMRETGTLPIFIGDDRTDEDGFLALGGDSITIHVGHRRKTQARYRLADVEQVRKFLEHCLCLARDEK
jgi:trehalose-phosphatase